ncbi:MAG: alanine racemase [Alkalispirochaeta sp.]
MSRDQSDCPLRRTRAYIDLDAVEHNLSLLAARVPESGLVPAVKADAYGHGVEAIASVCEAWGATMLAVANLEEYLLLRDQGITVPVLILEDLFPEEVEPALRAGARLSVGSVDYARMLSETAVQVGTTAMMHVNVETGMGRMGLFEPDPVSAMLTIASLASSTLEGIFSHFPASDEADKEFAHTQIDDLQSLLAVLKENGVTPRFRHIANSGALIDFPGDVAWDLVRPGIAMYGMYPSREVDQTLGLRPVMQLESAVVKITCYDRDWTVGYGRTYPVRSGSVIGIVPIGYGDGYPRSLSNRGEVLVHGVRVPIAGRVSMDMIAIDLTRLTGRVAIGDTVVLMGSQGDEAIDAAELADLTGTITYEITCGFTSRVPRIYLRNDEVVATKTFRSGYQQL